MPAVIAKKRAAAVAAKPSVDYPQRNETVVSESYAIRVTVPDGTLGVEVSINDGPWHACRPAAGHWWFDWSGFGEGRHEIVARHALPDGRSVRSESRKIAVRKASAQGA